MDKLIRSLLASIKQANKKKTSAYDTTAQVRRIEGNTAWVHIPGGVDETPVKLTVNAEPGDTVQLRVGGGTAWIVGNQTSPPTDDKVAKVANRTANAANVLAGLAKETADQAGKTATNYLSWSSEYGLIVSEDATEDPTEMEGGNTRITSEGMEVYKGQTLLARFGREIALYSNVGVPLAYFGYSRGPSGTGSFAQYYTLGVRTGDAEKYSVAMGYMAEASGQRSHAQNNGTVAASADQTAIGRYNKRDSIGEYAFIIGNGTGNSGDVYERNNALTVDWNGYVTHAGDGTYNIASNITRSSGATVSRCTVTVYGKVCQLVLGLVYNTSVAPGNNIFEGTLDPLGWNNVSYVAGVGYYGQHSIVGRIGATGEIVVRNSSSTAVTISNEALLTFTYIMD